MEAVEHFVHLIVKVAQLAVLVLAVVAAATNVLPENTEAMGILAIRAPQVHGAIQGRVRALNAPLAHGVM